MPIDIPEEVDILGHSPDTPEQAERRARAAERVLELVESFESQLDWELGDRWDDVVQDVMATLIERSRDEPRDSSDWALYKNNAVARSYVRKMVRNAVIDVGREERPDGEEAVYFGAPGEARDEGGHRLPPDRHVLTPEEETLDRDARQQWERAWTLFYEQVVPTVTEALTREDWARKHRHAVYEMTAIRLAEETIETIVDDHRDDDESYSKAKRRVHKQHQRARDRNETFLAELPETTHWEEWELDATMWGRLWGIALWMRQRAPSDVTDVVPDEALDAMRRCQQPAIEDV